MISRKEMLPLLVQACPSFQADYEAFIEEWKSDPMGLPDYVALADFGRHLVEKSQSGDGTSFPAVFTLIERFLKEGDSFVKEAAEEGILEGLSPVFESFLLPESKRIWSKING